MPPLLCGSPLLLDQSFPRGNEELQYVAITLGMIEKQVKKGDIHLILTDGLAEFVNEFDWDLRSSYPLLIEIYRLICQWFLNKHDCLIRIDVSDIQNYVPHSIPNGCNSGGLSELWADEVGRLLTIHDSCCPRYRFFIGIACELSYSGLGKNKYINPKSSRTFPLVGPDDVGELIDAYIWDTSRDLTNKDVCFNDFMNNYRAIGASHVIRPSGGSHCKVVFPNNRPWPLDPNNDPIPECYLKELEQITGYPLPVIKTALITGMIPQRLPRIIKTSVQ